VVGRLTTKKENRGLERKMKIQVGDIVKVLGNQFLHTVLDMSECEIEEFNEVLVQRIDNTKDQWVFTREVISVESN
jgi:hypothetical protein